VRRVARGESLLDPRLVARVIERITNPPKSDSLFEALRPGASHPRPDRAGQTNRQIAEHMFLRRHTVKNYTTTLLRKLKMTNRTEAAIFATKLRAEGSGPERA